MSADTETFSPVVVCLCGSTKFREQFYEATERETLAGRIVLSVGFFAHALSDEERAKKLTPSVKTLLDELHLRKIDLADEVLILNVDGYLGASTRREAWYALRTEKKLRWLVEPVQHPELESVEAWVRSWFADWDAWHAAGEVAARG